MSKDETEEFGRTLIGDQDWLERTQDIQIELPPLEDITLDEDCGDDEGDFAIDGYELREVLGRGGMGEVYLADRINSTGVSVPCAVKTILENTMVGDIDLQELLLDEARICSQLRHPNIVSIMDVGHSRDRLYIAMEWVEGIDSSELSKLARKLRKTIPFKHVLYIIRGALMGLHYAHVAVDAGGTSLKIVHRDISPDNILISRQGAVKLADFGVALGKMAHYEAAQGMTAGKPAYKAPELWKGEPASVQSDIFAMGATMYELVTGQQLFELEDNFFVLMKKIIDFDINKVIEGNLTLPEGIEDILVSSLSSDPKDRYATALEFLEDVNDFCYETGVRLLDAHFSRYIERMLQAANEISES